MLHIQPSTRYSLHKLLCHAAYTRSRAFPLCVFCASQQFPMSQANADIKFREQCLSESQKKHRAERENTKIETQHTHTHTGNSRQAWGTKAAAWQNGNVAIRVAWPLLQFKLHAGRKGNRGGKLAGANNDAIAGVDIVIMWCCSLMCVVPLSCAC